MMQYRPTSVDVCLADKIIWKLLCVDQNRARILKLSHWEVYLSVVILLD
jgi:hypothetical protein